MKKQMMYQTAKNLSFHSSPFPLAALLAVFLLGSIRLAAQQKAPKENAPVVHYAGKNNDQPLVQVSFDNEEGLYYDMTIRDPQGTLLYANRFRDKKFAKTFQVAQEEPGDIQLIISFTSGKSKHRQSIQISTTSYVKDEYLITKL